MATADQIAELRRKISEPDQTTYSDADLSNKIDNGGSINAVAADIWEEKSAMYSEMVDISEAGSSRKNSQLSSNARAQASYFRQQAAGQQPVAGVDFPTTRAIRRA